MLLKINRKPRPFSFKIFEPSGESLILDSQEPNDPRIAAVLGRAGRDGGNNNVFNFTQAQPESAWVVNHLKGFYPSIIQVLSEGRIVGFGYNVQHISENQLIIYFGQPFAGTAIVG
jgi:hypothetical protein